MSKIKAVVLERSGSRCTVLDENGSFRHVRRRNNANVGEEIVIQTGLIGIEGLRAWAGVAALFLMVLTTLLGWNLYQAPTAVALLSVDINPSIQFTIDAQGKLIKIDTQNEDAKKLVSKIDLKGKPIDKAFEQIVDEAYNQKFLNSERPWIVVGYSSLVDNGLEQATKDLNQNQILTWVTENAEDKGFTPQVAFFSLTPQDRELAQKGELTLGEYALWQTAEKAGVVTQPEKLKDTSERVRLLENPIVQAKVKENEKENKKEFQSSTSPSNGLTSEQGKGKDQEIENYNNKNDQSKGQNNIDKDKDKDKDIGKNEDKVKGKETEKEGKEEKEKEKGRENKNNGALNNTSKLSPLISGYESLPKKGFIVNKSPLRWGTSRF